MPVDFDDDDDAIELYWDELSVSTQRAPAEPEAPKFEADAGDLVIGTSRERILVLIKANGQLVYGPEYTPDEAAVVFWEAMGRRRLGAEERILVIHHMDRVLTALGAADIRNERAVRALSERQSQANLIEAQRAQAALERAMHLAIELGRGLTRRPDIPQAAAPTRVPAIIRDNPNSSYGDDDDDFIET